MADFLLEIGTEEIPDWMIEPALEDFRTKFQSAFGTFGGSALETDATPRRLVLLAKDLIEQAPNVETMVLGPYVSAGAKAAEGFARKQSTTVDKLNKVPDSKGERYVFHRLTTGQALADALSQNLPEIVGSISFPKTMYWTGKTGVHFIRPIRWIVALLDDQLVRLEVAGVKSGNTTRGHRILGSKQPIPVTIRTYGNVLRQNFVIVHAEERKQRIEAGLGSNVQKDDDLLRTLVYLTEFPTLDSRQLRCRIPAASERNSFHRDAAPPALFFRAEADGSLAPEFVAITNTDGDPDGLIRQGNERVLRARFNDARFFWEVDQRKKLSARVPDLAKVTFQAKLGSYKDKTDRVVKLAGDLAAQTGADQNTIAVARTALQMRSHHRHGERVHRIARRSRRPLCKSPRRKRSCRHGDLRSLQAGKHGRLHSTHARRSDRLHRRQTGHALRML